MSFVKQHNECSWICFYDCQRDVFHLVMWHGDNNTATEITSEQKFAWGLDEEKAMKLLVERGEQYITGPNYPQPPIESADFVRKEGIWSDANTRFLSGIPEPSKLVLVK
jgi:hypothetical protein